MNKRKLRKMYRRYLFSYSFEVLDSGHGPMLKSYDPKAVLVPIKK
jgi:hypothetical protein